MPVKPDENDTLNQQPVVEPIRIEPQPINGQQSGLDTKKSRTKKLAVKIISIIGAVIVGIGIAAWLWYSAQLSPLASDKDKYVLVTIDQGSSPSQIGELLKEKSVIRSQFAFDVYTRLSGNRGKLQAGTYRLSPSSSTSAIVEQLTSGKVATFTIRFLPGATLADHRKVLIDAGYTEREVDAALSRQYTVADSPLFQDKPSAADLEGYIYGETYQFAAGVGVEDILNYTFKKFNDVITENNIVAGLKAQGLNLYEGVTLASIIQREVASSSGASQPSSDQKQVAQVFYTRLATGMPLGSDVTFIYAAKKLGVEPVSTLQSPYNTRIVAGLPPGPISSPGLTALLAATSPAQGDYVYFVAGDDGKTYFGRTLQEHEANVAAHCGAQCQKP